MKKLCVCVLFGGVSPEHEVSLRSAESVLNNIDQEKYNVILVGITEDGHWLKVDSLAQIKDDTWREAKAGAVLSPDAKEKCLIVTENGKFEKVPVDVVFPVLHGLYGEDGTVQGILELAKIPYVGCGTLASAVCMDKAVTHTLLSAANIEQAHYLWFYADRYFADGEKIRNKIAARLNFPVFVKPANAGSSVGVSKVTAPEKLDAAIRLAAENDTKVVVEEGIVGQEVECAVLGNRGKSVASPVGEIGAGAEFYDYDDKYKNGVAQLFIPARLPEDVAEEVRKTAVRAYNLLGCDGLSRVDFFVTEKEHRVILNEINTLPGFTSISMYPKLWENAGTPYSELLEKLIDCAFTRED